MLASCSEKKFSETITSTFEVPATVNKANMAAQGNVIVVEASPDVSWTATKEAEDTWITLNQTEGTGSGEIIYALTENSETDPRSAVITFQATGTNASFTKTCTVTQIGTAPIVLIDPNGATTIPGAEVTGYPIKITSNVAWSIDVTTNDEGDWATVTDPDSQTGSGEYTALLNIAENDTGASRTVTITVSADNFTGVSQQLVITQLQQGVSYTITFTGLTGQFTDGAAAMAIAPAEGSTTTLNGDISDDGTSTVFTFPDMLTEGTTYRISSITPSGGSATPFDCLFKIGAGGLVTWVEYYDAALACFGGSSEERPLPITSEADLIKLRDAVNGGNSYAGLYLAQTVDIALTTVPWTPIGTSVNRFSGIYLGNNHNITGLSINTATANQALFGAIGGLDAETVATIKGLTVKGIADNAGYDVTATASASNFAGVVAMATSYSLVDGCTNYAKISAGVGAEDAMGGIMGTANGDNITITGCRNYAALNNPAGVCGGIAGNIPAAATGNRISKCYNFGNITVTGTGLTGGILGRITSGGVHTVEMSGNHGNITLSIASTRGTAGVLGLLNGPADESKGRTTVSQCYNLGNHTSTNNLGGVVGLCNTASATYTQVLNCYNKGTLSFGTRTAVNSAGVVGNVTTNYTVKIVNSYNAGTASGTVTAGDKFGAIVAANTIPAGGTSEFTGVSGCYYLNGINYPGGIGGSITPADAAGKAEGKDAAFFATAISGWDADIWDFSGTFPTLKNAPEQTP